MIEICAHTTISLRGDRPWPFGHGDSTAIVKEIAGSQNPTLKDILKRDRREENVDLVAQFLPKIVSQTAAAIVMTTGRSPR